MTQKKMKKGKSKDGRKDSARTRSQKTWDPAYSQDGAFKLRPSASRELVKIAGARSELVDSMCARVQTILSMYPSMEVALDQKPRPGTVLRELKCRLKEARTLRDWIAKRSEPLAWELACEGFHATDDMQTLLWSLDGFLTAGERLSRRPAPKKSRHGPTRHAFRAVVGKLSCIFDVYYRGEESYLQTLKADFVKVALTAAEIPSPSFVPADGQTASNSRFVRQLPKPCTACRARGRGEQLVRDIVWQGIQAGAKKLRETAPEMSPEQAVDAFVQTRRGQKLYEACRARGKGEPLVRDVARQRIQAEAEKYRRTLSGLSPEQAEDAFLETPEGQKLYEAYRTLFLVPLTTARSRRDLQRLLGEAGITLDPPPSSKLRANQPDR